MLSKSKLQLTCADSNWLQHRTSYCTAHTRTAASHCATALHAPPVHVALGTFSRIWCRRRCPPIHRWHRCFHRYLAWRSDCLGWNGMHPLGDVGGGERVLPRWANHWQVERNERMSGESCLKQKRGNFSKRIFHRRNLELVKRRISFFVCHCVRNPGNQIPGIKICQRLFLKIKKSKFNLIIKLALWR